MKPMPAREMYRLFGVWRAKMAVGLTLIAAVSVLAACGPIGSYGAYGGMPSYAHDKLPRERIPWYFPDPSVPPPRFPAAHPDAVYKEGMTARQYFDHLCKLEAGEFISRTVEGVEGIYLLRPRYEPNDALLYQREAMEDPYSAVASASLYYSAFHRAYTLAFQAPKGDRWGQYIAERSYKFTEKPYLEPKDVFGLNSHYVDALYSKTQDEFDAKDSFISLSANHGDEKLRRAKETQGRYLRYARNWPIEYKVPGPGGWHFAQNGYLIERRVDTLRSRYGVAWRGIQRPRDREMGIGGGELYVIDLATNEIIAYRRGFVLSGKPGDGPVYWASLRHCPSQFPSGRNDDVNNPPPTASNFIRRVLIPSTSLPGKE